MVSPKELNALIIFCTKGRGDLEELEQLRKQVEEQSELVLERQQLLSELLMQQQTMAEWK